MNLTPCSRATARTVLLAAGTLAGLALSQPCFANGLERPSASAIAYTRALETGYAAGEAAVAPTRIAPAPANISPGSSETSATAPMAPTPAAVPVATPRKWSPTVGPVDPKSS